jgi:hypothetical protein
MRIGLLASGNLGFIVLEYMKSLYHIEFVMTDKKSNIIIDFVLNNIPASQVTHVMERLIHFCISVSI